MSWTNVLNVDFSTKADGYWQSGWCKYGGLDQVYKQGYYAASHVYVKGGLLHLLARHDASGPNGSQWYTGGFSLHGTACGTAPPYLLGGRNHRLTVRQRLVENGQDTMGHRNILLWPEPPWTVSPTRTMGEVDMWESQAALNNAALYVHYGMGSGNYQVAWTYPTKWKWTDWHTFRFERTITNHTVRIFVDNMVTPIHVYQGNSTTMPDNRLYWGIQQQMRRPGGMPAPSGSTEDWQISSLQLDHG